MISHILSRLERLAFSVFSIVCVLSVVCASGCSSSDEEKPTDTEMSREELAKQYRQQSEGLLNVKQPKPTLEP